MTFSFGRRSRFYYWTSLYRFTIESGSPCEGLAYTTFNEWRISDGEKVFRLVDRALQLLLRLLHDCCNF
jgi:hypothetical protein